MKGDTIPRQRVPGGSVTLAFEASPMGRADATHLGEDSILGLMQSAPQDDFLLSREEERYAPAKSAIGFSLTDGRFATAFS